MTILNTVVTHYTLTRMTINLIQKIAFLAIAADLAIAIVHTKPMAQTFSRDTRPRLHEISGHSVCHKQDS